MPHPRPIDHVLDHDLITNFELLTLIFPPTPYSGWKKTHVNIDAVAEITSMRQSRDIEYCDFVMNFVALCFANVPHLKG